MEIVPGIAGIGGTIITGTIIPAAAGLAGTITNAQVQQALLTTPY